MFSAPTRVRLKAAASSALEALTVGRPFHQAQALEDAAALEAGRGDLTVARRHLAEALGVYTALGAAWDVERAGARLRPYGVRAKRAAYRARPVSGWDALTPTEVKVAYLAGISRADASRRHETQGQQLVDDPALKIGDGPAEEAPAQS